MGAGPLTGGMKRWLPHTAPQRMASAAVVVALLLVAVLVFAFRSQGRQQAVNPAPSPTATATPVASVAAQPSPRIGAALAFDGARGKLLLFSGVRGGGSSVAADWTFQDTWSWNAKGWTEVHPVASPPGRSFGSVAYDIATQSVVLFGGGSANSDAGRSDTWSWDGTTWTQLHPSTSPPHMEQPSFAYDGATRSAVLFGVGAGGTQTWTWNGSAWRMEHALRSPPLRFQAAMAYDALRNNLLLFGGVGGAFAPLTDTWSWDGSGWRQLSPPTTPPGGSAYAAFDPIRGTVVLFVAGQTWTWNGKDWSQQHPATSPQARLFASMAYDEAIGRVVLFGGKCASDGCTGVQVYNDLWSWDGTIWTREA